MSRHVLVRLYHFVHTLHNIADLGLRFFCPHAWRSDSRKCHPSVFCIIFAFLQISLLFSLYSLVASLFLHFFSYFFSEICLPGDDAKDVRIVPITEILQLPLAFDHRQILSDYLAKYHAFALMWCDVMWCHFMSWPNWWLLSFTTCNTVR